MYFEKLVNRDGVAALEKMLAFTQARQRMLAENIANVDTPGFQARQLDVQAFQASLRKALDAQQARGSSELPLKSTDEFRLDAGGLLKVTPSAEPAENVLFQDKTNVRIERQMAMMAENTMMHQAVTELLKGKFDLMLKAIRGRA